VLGVEEALATLDEAMDRCLAVPLFPRSSQQLLGYLDRLHAHQQRLAAVQAALVRELEVLGVPGRRGATNTAAWLRARYRVSPGAAKRLACPAEITGPFGPQDLGRLGERILEHVAPQLLEQQAETALERAERTAYDKREFNITDIAGTSKVRVHGLLDREGAAHLRAAIDPVERPRPTEDGPDPRTRRRVTSSARPLCRKTELFVPLLQPSRIGLVASGAGQEDR